MNTKILFSDFDGTLYVNRSVSQANREAVRRWRASGRLFCLATGRQVADLRAHLAREGVEYDYLLCLNGAEGYDREGRPLFARDLDGAVLPELFDCMLAGRGWANVCFGERLERILAPVGGAQTAKVPCYGVERLGTFPRFSQICTEFEDMSASAAARDRLLARYGGVVSAEINGRCLDVNAAGVRKSFGIATLLDVLGLDAADACAVGDNFNDLCMITAYRGCAVAGAPEEVRARAGRTVADVAQLIGLLLENGMN